MLAKLTGVVCDVRHGQQLGVGSWERELPEVEDAISGLRVLAFLFQPVGYSFVVDSGVSKRLKEFKEFGNRKSQWPVWNRRVGGRGSRAGVQRVSGVN